MSLSIEHYYQTLHQVKTLNQANYPVIHDEFTGRKYHVLCHEIKQDKRPLMVFFCLNNCKQSAFFSVYNLSLQNQYVATAMPSEGPFGFSCIKKGRLQL